MPSIEFAKNASLNEVRKLNTQLAKKLAINLAVGVAFTVATIVLTDQIDKRLTKTDEN